ncbi:MAG: tetraacyldisaccharide 4'-kinase [Pelagibacteraceae bacterium]|nr:tetraacyldisaccharide 4'-kinase [Pelagibacteraceae bacterium]
MKVYKPKFWDSRKFSFWPYFFFPFALIINLINLLKFKYSKKEKFDIPIILVGNIYLGGTGKTPLCIEIFQILRSLKLNPAFVKKHHEKYADETKLLENIGKVFSNKQRSEAVKSLISNNFKVAIFDDGFQDPGVKSDISIICFNEKQWIGNGFVIPSGPLREKLNALKRCNYVFINGNQNLEFEKTINKFNPEIKIFYTQYKLTNLDDMINRKVIAFAGIGNPENFFDLLKNNNIEIIETLKFPDHYNFKKIDIANLNERARELDACLVTTGKDYFRLSNEDKKNIKYLKFELLIDKKEEFINELKKII